MGTPEDEFKFVVEDVLEETRESQPEFKDLVDAHLTFIGILGENEREYLGEDLKHVDLE